jgi:hypothetical protein
MALQKQKLADQVQDIVTDALDTIGKMVRDALNDELHRFLDDKAAAAASRPRKPGKKPAKKAAPKKAKKAAKKTVRKAAKRSAPKPVKKAARKSGRKIDAGKLTEELVRLVNQQGDIAPKEARKVLHISDVQMQGLARDAARDGKIKVLGKGRGTRYVQV